MIELVLIQLNYSHLCARSFVDSLRGEAIVVTFGLQEGFLPKMIYHYSRRSLTSIFINVFSASQGRCGTLSHVPRCYLRLAVRSDRAPLLPPHPLANAASKEMATLTEGSVHHLQALEHFG